MKKETRKKFRLDFYRKFADYSRMNENHSPTELKYKNIRKPPPAFSSIPATKSK